MGDEEENRAVAEQKALPVQHLVVQQGMGFSLPPAAEPMVVLSLADFNRLEPVVPVRISFLKELAALECDDQANGEVSCQFRGGRRCLTCSIKEAAERYLAISAKERGSF